MITFQELYESVDEDFRHLLDERAAIHQFDGRMTRAESEIRAVKDLFTRDHLEAADAPPWEDMIF